MIRQDTTAAFWGRKSYRTGETNPFDPETREHREFVHGRMMARELEQAQRKLLVDA